MGVMMALFYLQNIKTFLKSYMYANSNMGKEVLLLIVAILLVGTSSAAILHGSIYDSNLHPMNNVVVEVDSEPPQNFISKEGQYSFVLDTGDYTLKAMYDSPDGENWYLERNISIQRNGYFVVDLLFDKKANTNGPGSGIISFWFVGFLIAILVLGAVLFFVFRKGKKPKEEVKLESDQYADELLKIIKKEGGRTTQKDIRKELPLSEGKVSLMISELEEKGIVKRIKKGRGNIIILQK